MSLLTASQRCKWNGCGAEHILPAEIRTEGDAMPYELPPLPYDYNALEPHIDEQTMRIHHGKHHQAYVTNLNTALESSPELQKLSVEALLRDLNKVPEATRMAVRNNAGGHHNHTLFWDWLKPGGAKEPPAA